MRRSRRTAPDDPELRAQVVAEDDVLWIGIRHFSPACAVLARDAILQARPAAVLVEGPDDATDLIAHLVHPDTRPPVTVLSSYVDKRNAFGQNGVLSPAPGVPARYRGWWPLVPWSPEYQALRAGAEVGAELQFIDLPLRASIPLHHVAAGRPQRAVDDRQLQEGRYLDALAARWGAPDFDAFWQGAFEVQPRSVEALRRAILVFASCVRAVDTEPAALDADGTTAREAHMRWYVDRARKRHPDGVVAVVTGAFHSVALPFARPKRHPVRADRYTTTMLCAHSFRALDRLYALGRAPGHGHAVWARLAEGAERPWDDAALELLLGVMRAARGRGALASTADAVGAWRAAMALAELRRHAQVTRRDLCDAAELAYVKGTPEHAGQQIATALAEALTGHDVGEVTAEAGTVPLRAAYYADARTFRIDTTGARKNVRCDLHKVAKHRQRSAFLHRCAYLDLPMFDELDDRGWRETSGAYRGPDLVTGEGMHLITETWALRWTEAVDDRLLELSDLGPSVGSAAATALTDELVAAGQDVAATTRLLLRAVQMVLVELFDRALDAVDDAVARDSDFARLSGALSDFVLLFAYHDALATHDNARVAASLDAVYRRACLSIPSLAGAAEADVPELLDGLGALVRHAVTLPLPSGAALDLGLLIERLHALLELPDAHPAVRGAGLGVLYGLGEVSPNAIAGALSGVLRGTQRRGAGAFLDGLFRTGRNAFLVSDELRRVVDDALAELSWDDFRALLPDLRRAFARFIPSELDAIAAFVERGAARLPVATGGVSSELRRALRELDARVERVLAT